MPHAGDITNMANFNQDAEEAQAIRDTFPRLTAGTGVSHRQGVTRLDPHLTETGRETSESGQGRVPHKRAASEAGIATLRIQDAHGQPISLASVVYDDAAEVPRKLEGVLNAVEDFFTVPPEKWFMERSRLLEDLDAIVKHGECRKLWEGIEVILDRWSGVIREGLLNIAGEAPQNFLRTICVHYYNWKARTQLLGGYLAVIEGRFLRPRQGKTIPHISLSIFIKNVLLVSELKEKILEIIQFEFTRWLTATETVDLAAMGELVRVYTNVLDALKRETPNSSLGNLDLNPHRWISRICINILMDQLNPQKGPNPASILSDWVDRYHKVVRLMNYAAEQMELKQLGQYAEFSQLAFGQIWFSRMKPLLAAALFEPNGSEQLHSVVCVLTGMEDTKPLIEDFLLRLLDVICDVVKNPATRLHPGQGTHLVLKIYQTIGIALKGNTLLPWGQFSERCWKLITEKLPNAHSGLIDVLLNLVNASLADQRMENHLETLKPLLRQLRESDEKIGWAFAGRMATHLLPKHQGRFDEKEELAIINRMADDLGQNFLWRVRVMLEDLRLQKQESNVLYINPVAWPVSEMDKDGLGPMGQDIEAEFSAINKYSSHQTKQAKLHLNWTVVRATVGDVDITCTAAQFAVLKALSTGLFSFEDLKNVTKIDSAILASAILDLFEKTGGLLCKTHNDTYTLNENSLKARPIDAVVFRTSACPE